MSELPKRCGCCGHEYTPAAWGRLPLVGVQPVPGWPSIELRNCPCGTTLAVELSDPGDPGELDRESKEQAA